MRQFQVSTMGTSASIDKGVKWIKGDRRKGDFDDQGRDMYQDKNIPTSSIAVQAGGVSERASDANK